MNEMGSLCSGNSELQDGDRHVNKQFLYNANCTHFFGNTKEECTNSGRGGGVVKGSPGKVMLGAF